MSHPIRRKVLFGMAGALAMVAVSAQAQQWPSRPIKLVTQYATGGTSDLAARLVGEQLAKRLNTAVIVENKPGAGGRIASSQVAKSMPDGYTLLWTAAIHTTNAAFFDDLGYDTEKDFEPVVQAFALPAVLVVPASSPARTAAEYVKLAKQDPKQATVGYSGTASIPHLMALQFIHSAGLSVSQVGYKGDVPAIQDLLGGHIPAAFVSLGTPVPHVGDGKLRVLAMTGNQHTDLLPGVPTFAEGGVDGMDGFAWFGLVAPAGTPPAIVRRLNTEINDILKNPDLLAAVGKSGATPIGGSAEEFKAFIHKDIAKWKQLAKATNLKITP
ncbi:tripartite tricarboxylate transporter substrate binding protein [Hydrogenophaga sp.]|uniref:Bug family tripartite tricarboxylate transporter substrate binding protein n=1 Tax=Hydrogenophaga sp. TaxID=1904254 RepID=UPI0026156A6A|nr:tripartite tricarboxylate transporter substrate binding protein [Hydrogenophaga sp.]MCW5654271.1 tripartite tricarboxylate transporter substrate binding protein [Hydrogenophaga sp.]